MSQLSSLSFFGKLKTSVLEIKNGINSILTRARENNDRPETNESSYQNTKIYGLIDPRTNQIRYIGKTIRSLGDRLSQHMYEKAKHHRAMWILGLKYIGLQPQIVLIETIPLEGNWIAAERKWIAYYKSMGYSLVNKTDGGEGVIGLKHSDASRKKMSLQHLGKKLPTLTRQRISQSLKRFSLENPGKLATRKTGIKHSEKTKAKLRIHINNLANDPSIRKKISDSKLGKPLSEKHKKAISESHKGKKLSTEHKSNIGNSIRALGIKPPNHTGKKRSPKTRELMSRKQIGKKLTPETREKISLNKSKLLKPDLVDTVKNLTRQGLSIRKIAKAANCS